MTLSCLLTVRTVLTMLRVQDATDHELALEARWFYDPDRDEDGERAMLVRSMMRRPGKRSETMKYKQYYWKPLAKITRWDREDDL